MRPSIEENGENTVFCQGELLIFSNLKNTLAGILSFAYKKWVSISMAIRPPVG
jgi:hypothetical protein